MREMLPTAEIISLPVMIPLTHNPPTINTAATTPKRTQILESFNMFLASGNILLMCVLYHVAGLYVKYASLCYPLNEMESLRQTMGRVTAAEIMVLAAAIYFELLGLSVLYGEDFEESYGVLATIGTALAVTTTSLFVYLLARRAITGRNK